MPTEQLYIGDTLLTPQRLHTLPTPVPPTLRPLLSFLSEWWDPLTTHITAQTSGSTGTPKQIKLEKSAVRRSAQRTNQYFGITKRQRLLLAMDLRYIGAKMMVVRAAIAGAELVVVPPTSHPLATLSTPPHFVSLVPLQLHHTLETPSERQLLSRVQQLIIGGGAIHPHLLEWLDTLPIPAYATYGMTETISHIALRRLNGTHATQCYYPLDGVQLTLGTQGELIIHDHLLFPNQPPIITNDLAEIHPDGGFVIKGRTDNIINTGGVKISPEQIEQTLSHILRTPLAISWIPDSALGQKTVLILQADIIPDNLDTILQKHLPPYHRPKEVRLLPQLPHNPNGKLDRKALHRLLLSEE